MIRRALRWSIALALLIGAGGLALPALPARAQTPVPLDLDGRPSVFRDAAGRASGCALRLFGVQAAPAPRDVYRTVDVALLLSADSLARRAGLIKAYSYEASGAAVREGKPAREFRVVDAWLRLPDGERTRAVAGSTPPAERNPNVLAYVAEARPLLEVVDAALAGRPVEVGLARDGEPPAAFVGVPKFDPVAQRDLAACMRALAADVQAKPPR